MDESSRVAWAFDLDGVLWTGRDPIQGSADAVAALVEGGHRVAFVTNNSFATVAEQEAKLASFGIAAQGRVITSAMAGASLVEEGERVYVLGGPGIVEAVEARGAVVVDGAGSGERADVVLVGLDRNLSYERLSGAVLALHAGARFVATNTDSTYPSERGMLPGGGSIVAAVRYATGAEPVVAGKPHDAQAQLVRSVLGPDGVMIGDRPETDGRFASAMGYRFGLVLTGVTGRDDLPIEPEPSWVEDDVARLVPRILAEL
ncbi:MAG: HAD-IIA family hydrolase [Acidimicrobiia bacterium]|nr:HAD-IIA family hydrolase [Acidimicrobiia bacterium]